MANKALLVGINRYPLSPLRGCVNDVTDMADFLMRRCDFNENDIHMLIDGNATKAAIIDGLTAFVGSLKAGDRAVFHFSGHGVQLPSLSGNAESDGLDEAVCPVDFTWDDEHSGIRDKDFHRIFAGLPPGLSFVWVSDSCHSGDISKVMSRNGFSAWPRSFEPTTKIAARLKQARSQMPRGFRGLRAIADRLQLALVTGCEADQTSTDAIFDGRANGALTYYLLGTLSSDGALGRKLFDIVRDTRQTLASNGFSQRPQLEGAHQIQEQPFLSLTAPTPCMGTPAPFMGGFPTPGTTEKPSWYDVFLEIDRRIGGDRAFERKLIAGNERRSRDLARERRIELGNPILDTFTEDARPRGGTVARAFWWGFHIQISREDLLAFLGVADPVNAVAAAIGPVTGPAAVWVGMVAAFIAGALEALRSLDHGNGVYVSMSWFAPGVFIPTTV